MRRDRRLLVSLSPGLLSGSHRGHRLLLQHPRPGVRNLNAPARHAGQHQAANAAVALRHVAELRHQGWCISTEAMRSGLSQAALPGRVEIVPGDPTVVLDTAHNPASARALVEALAELPFAAPDANRFASVTTRMFRAIVRELAPHFDRIIVTQYQDNPAGGLNPVACNSIERAPWRARIGAHHLRHPGTGLAACDTNGIRRRADLHRRLVLSGSRDAPTALPKE